MEGNFLTVFCFSSLLSPKNFSNLVSKDKNVTVDSPVFFSLFSPTTPPSRGHMPQLSALVVVVQAFQHKKGATGEKDTVNNVSKHFAATMLYYPEAVLVVRSNYIGGAREAQQS